jgi:hypothetical protein
MAKLPETIHIVNVRKTHLTRYHELKHLKQQTNPTDETYEFIHLLYRLYKNCKREHHYIDIQNEPKTIAEIHRYVEEMYIPGNKKYTPTYIGRCPIDQCKGFINTQFICELCYSHICDKCQVPILIKPSTDNSESETPIAHICDENTVSTIQLLKKDTKPCPKCHVNIFKIDGCDQMWCIECHTAFSWTTGEVEHKIHNPHYYEYLRNTNQHQKLIDLNNHNIACNPEEEEYDILNNFPTVAREVFYELSMNNTNLTIDNIKQIRDVFIGIDRTITHIEQFEIPRNYNIELPTNELDTLRLTYALNKITEKDYKRNITKIYKRQSYNEDISQLLHTFIIILKDLLKIHTSKLIFDKTIINLDTIEIIRKSFIEAYSWLDLKFEETATIFNYTPLCLAHDLYFPGCTIKQKSRVPSDFVGESGFYIVYS